MLYYTGFSLNQLSIAGFVLALGLLVDDSIVVVENIARYRAQGYSPRRGRDRRRPTRSPSPCSAARRRWCSPSCPLLFLPEGAGEFIRSLPAAVLFTVLASLFVSLTVIPFLASRMLQPRGRSTSDGNRLLRRRSMRGIHRALPTRCCTGRWRDPLLRRCLVRADCCSPRRRRGRACRSSASACSRARTSPQFRHARSSPGGRSIAETDRALRSSRPSSARTRRSSAGTRNLGHGNPFIYYNVIPAGDGPPTSARCSSSSKAYDPRRTPQLFEELRAQLRELSRRTHPASKQFEQGPPIDSADRDPHRRPGARRAARASRRRSKQADQANAGHARRQESGARCCAPISTSASTPRRPACSACSPVEVDRTVRLAVAGSRPASSAPATATSTTSRCACRCRERHDARGARLDLVSRPRPGGRCRCGQIASPRFDLGPELDHRYNRERAGHGVSAVPAARLQHAQA